MKNDNNKYLVISLNGIHEELMETIRENAQKEKSSVSHYVRTLLYKALNKDVQENTSAVDVRRAARAVASSVRQSR